MSQAVSVQLPRRCGGTKDNFEWEMGYSERFGCLWNEFLWEKDPNAPSADSPIYNPYAGQWSNVKQRELFCNKCACIVLFEWGTVCCFMFGTGWVCESMFLRGSRKEKLLASAEMNAPGQKCLPDLREPKGKRGTWGQVPFPPLICSEVITGLRILRPVISQMRTRTHIYLSIQSDPIQSNPIQSNLT